PSMLDSIRDWRFWATLVVLFAINFFIVNVIFAPAQPKQVTIPYTVFKAQVVANNVVSVTSTGESTMGVTKNPVGAPPSGTDEAKAELQEVVDFLRQPQRYQRLGGTVPKGVLLVGLPGTGKTLLARAVAGEARVPFYSVSASEFIEMIVGVGASRVRDLFK